MCIRDRTMTTKDGSSLSQSKTHADVEDDVNDDDKAYVLEVLNHELLPKMEKRGYPVKGGWFIYPKKDNTTLSEKMTIAEKVDDRTENGIDEDYWYETFGLPKGKKPKTEAAAENKDPGTDDPTEPQEPKTKKQTKQPRKVQAKKLSLFNQLKDFFDRAPR